MTLISLLQKTLDHSRLLIQCKMVTLFVLIFLGCSAVTIKSEMCDRVQFSFHDQNNINTSQNFTKQSFVKNGQPVYYSFWRAKNHTKLQTIIWRNNENTIWLSQTRTWIGNKITKTKIKISFPNFFSFMQMSNIQTKFNGLLSAGHYSL